MTHEAKYTSQNCLMFVFQALLPSNYFTISDFIKNFTLNFKKLFFTSNANTAIGKPFGFQKNLAIKIDSNTNQLVVPAEWEKFYAENGINIIRANKRASLLDCIFL